MLGRLVAISPGTTPWFLRLTCMQATDERPVHDAHHTETAPTPQAYVVTVDTSGDSRYEHHHQQIAHSFSWGSAGSSTAGRWPHVHPICHWGMLLRLAHRTATGNFNAALSCGNFRVHCRIDSSPMRPKSRWCYLVGRLFCRRAASPIALQRRAGGSPSSERAGICHTTPTRFNARISHWSPAPDWIILHHYSGKTIA